MGAGRGKITAIILAAGLSSRMGAFKPLLEVGGKPALRYLVDHILEAGIDEVFIVTGHEAERIERIADGCATVFNPDFRRGMFTSVKAGLMAAAARGGFEGAMLFPVDAPFTPAKVIEALADRAAESPGAFAVPCFMGKKGHPLFIPADKFDEILAYEGEGGLGALTSRSKGFIYMETGCEGVVLDMDTPEGYEEALDYLKGSREGRDDLVVPAFEGRLIAIRHGSTVKHKGKIFLGRADVALSDKGRAEAAKAAEDLIRMGAGAGRIYASGLRRAKETAEIIAARLSAEGALGLPVGIIEAPALREMSLGDWDGKYIDDIRESDPEGYMERGRDILRYKRPGGENFYDLRYRVFKGLRRIAAREAAEGAKDLIVVTHLGVIRALSSLITGKGAEDAWGEEFARGSVTAFYCRGKAENDCPIL